MTSDAVSPLEIRHAQHDGAPIGFATVGQGAPLLFLPGGGGPSRMLWQLAKPRDFITSLAERYRVLLFDFSVDGISESKPPVPEELLATVVARLIAVLDAAGVERCHIVASFMTTIPAVALAARHPDRVSSLLLWDGLVAGTKTLPGQGVREMNDLVRGSDGNVASGAFAGTNGMEGGAKEFQEYREMFRTYPGLRDLLRLGRVAWRALAAADGRSDASQVVCRTLVVDPVDALMPGPGAAEELAQAIPDALLVQADEAATSPHLADHAVSVPLVLDWLSQGRGGERGPGAFVMERPLTPRELEVLELVEAGLSNRAIAQRLVLSVHTVDKHVSNVLKKLGASNRTDAARKARSAGMID